MSDTFLTMSSKEIMLVNLKGKSIISYSLTPLKIDFEWDTRKLGRNA